MIHILNILNTQNDTVLTRIAEASATTASNTTLGTFDWCSFAVAAIALMVSFFSLYYAVATLRSQERTERNTRRISFDVQSELLSALRADIFERFAKMYAVELYLVNHDFTAYPSRKFLNELKLSLSYVHETSDMHEDSRIYIAISMLREKISDYNAVLLECAKTLSDMDSPREDRWDALYLIQSDLKSVMQDVCELFCKYYAGTRGDNLDSIADLRTAEYSAALTIPIRQKMVSVKDRRIEGFIDVIIGRKENLSGRITSKEGLIEHLSKVTAWYLSSSDLCFYDFDMGQDYGRPYIKAWSGIKLATPSHTKKNKSNYGCADMFFMDEELRLYSFEEELFEPMLVYVKDGKQYELPFRKKMDDKRIDIRYYRIEFENNKKALKEIFSSDVVIIRYMPKFVNSFIKESYEDVEALYRVTFTGEEFYECLYCTRETSVEAGDRTKNQNRGAGTYDMSMNEQGEICLFIEAREAAPQNPRFVMDYSGKEALLYISRESALMLDIDSVARRELLNKQNILVVETHDDEVVREYYVKVLLVRSVAALGGSCEYDISDAVDIQSDEATDYARGEYDILQNSAGELLMVLGARSGEPENPCFLIDNTYRGALIRSEESAVICHEIADAAGDAIMSKSEMNVVETDKDENIVREYKVPIRVVISLDDVLTEKL